MRRKSPIPLSARTGLGLKFRFNCSADASPLKNFISLASLVRQSLVKQELLHPNNDTSADFTPTRSPVNIRKLKSIPLSDLFGLKIAMVGKGTSFFFPVS